MGWLVLGFVVLTVLLTSLFKNVNWSPRKKNVLAVVFSVVGAAITVILTQGGVDALLTKDLLESVILVYGGSQAFYQFILNGTKVENSLANVGNKNKPLVVEPILYDRNGE